MNTVTLEQIIAEHKEMSKTLYNFIKAQKPEQIFFPEIMIKLKSGEHYAGIILGKDGKQSHHLILLPCKGENLTWEKAKAWASNETNGGLPTRREQALLYANLKEQFQNEWYWSNEQHVSESHYAWYQIFNSGNQGYRYKHDKLRARAVRRLVIE